MHQVVFYPVGNGDTSQIVLENGKRILFDYRHRKESDTEGSTLFNLRKRLKQELAAAKRDFFDVLALTHGDDDHIANSTEFFELWCADKYKGDGRIKIKELWVPAAMILEPAASDQQSNEVVIWRREARYRLKLGRGIRVFSKPDLLKDWLKANGLTVDDRRHLITDAGSVVPGFTIAADEVEFFCHSPFVKHCDSGDILRNEASLIFQVRFEVNGNRFNYLAVGDSTHEVLDDIVDITTYHGNDDRLDWDLFNDPHHTSYLALGPEKGDKETAPTKNVEKLLLHGQPDAYIVSSSEPIGNDKAAYEQTQPPHVQAKNTYRKYLDKIRGRKFLVTMEEPSGQNPEPLVFDISGMGGRWVSASRTGAATIVAAPAPRAGRP
jgi:hypothetical protein